MNPQSTPSGLVLLNKPSDISSFKALNSIKKAAETRKVGHTGTLDPFASGLMVALVGKYTKFNSLITGMDKTYTAVYKLGEETDTLDPTGEIIKTGRVPLIEEILPALEELTGTLQQKPPIYSAIKINGKRAYKDAREGKIPEIPPREITVYRHEFISYTAPFLTVQIECSKGTYIRSLSRDLGLLCGSCAHVTELRRDSIGGFSLEEAVSPLDFNKDKDLHSIASYKHNFPMLSFLTLDDSEIKRKISLGQQLSMNSFPNGLSMNNDTVLMDSEEEIIAVVFREGSKIRYRFVA